MEYLCTLTKTPTGGTLGLVVGGLFLGLCTGMVEASGPGSDLTWQNFAVIAVILCALTWFGVGVDVAWRISGIPVLSPEEAEDDEEETENNDE